MLWLVRAVPFAVLLVLGAFVSLSRGSRYDRVAANAFILFFVAASVAVGLTQHDFWPFSGYPVIVESSGGFRNAVWYEVRAVDERGEHPLDASPLTPSVMDKWIERRFTTLHPAEKASVARFLLRDHCRNDALLGPLAAPDWLAHRNRSRAIHAATLRVYRHTASGRALVYEYRLE